MGRRGRSPSPRSPAPSRGKGCPERRGGAGAAWRRALDHQETKDGTSRVTGLRSSRITLEAGPGEESGHPDVGVDGYRRRRNRRASGAARLISRSMPRQSSAGWQSESLPGLSSASTEKASAYPKQRVEAFCHRPLVTPARNCGRALRIFGSNVPCEGAPLLLSAAGGVPTRCASAAALRDRTARRRLQARVSPPSSAASKPCQSEPRPVAPR